MTKSRRSSAVEEITLAPDDAPALTADDITLMPDDDGSDSDAELPTPEEVEAAALAEAGQALAGFKARSRQEDQRYEDSTDSEYWVALCFQTREQKEEFLRKMNWLELGDKYLDGMACAEVSGVTLESRIPPLPTHPIDRRYVQLAQPDRQR